MTAILSAKLQAYDTLLKKWQKTINLVANSTLDDTQTRHFDDSLQILPYLDAAAPGTVYDLGSGAGFPGLVIAAARPDIDCHLIEASQKKCNFLSAVVRELQIQNATIHQARIEDMAKDLPPPDMITARALADLETILDLTAPWTRHSPGPCYLLLKGENAEDEIRQAHRHFDFDVRRRDSTTQPGASVLEITKVGPRQK